MEFGKLDNIDQIDWTLPPNSPTSLKHLSQFGSDQTKFYIGAPMWGPKEWVGRIYPKGTKSGDFLSHYSRQYNCIELNTTHYQIPTEEKSRLWISQVPKEFLFNPKIPQSISHEDLTNKDLLKDWFRFLNQIQPNLGPCFLQFHHFFTYSQKAELFQFLKLWPKEFELALEFRHPSWFEGSEIRQALVEYLQTLGIGLVITDVAGRRDVLHTSISAPFSMLRFIGNNLHPSDQTRAKAWAERLGSWQQQGLQKMFVFVHEPGNPEVIDMSEIMIKELNTHADANLTPLQLVETKTQQSLFNDQEENRT